MEMEGNNNKNNRVVQTYVVGEDGGRLESIAKAFGLSQARKPADAVRGKGGKNVLMSFLEDVTLESARMHSVGSLAEDERVDKSGTIHILTKRTISKKQYLSVGDTPLGGGGGEGYYSSDNHAAPDYGSLMDLFESPPSRTSIAKIHKPTLPSTREGEEKEDEDSDDDVTLVVEEVGGGSLTAAVFGIIKGTIGSAVLFLPRGFKMAGYAMAIPCMIVSTVSYLYCATRLLECWKVEHQRSQLLASKLEQVKTLLTPTMPSKFPTNNDGNTENSKLLQDDSDNEDDITMYTSKVLSYPELGRRAFGSYGSFFIETGIAVLQFGVCLTYMIFVPQNLAQCVVDLSGGHIVIPQGYFLLIMLIIELPLSWIRDIRKLTPTNILATFLTLYGLLSCLLISIFWRNGFDNEGVSTSDMMVESTTVANDINNDELEDMSLLERFAHLPMINSTWYLFIGTSFFVFEGCITLLVPLQDAVYAPEDKEKFPAVNRRVTSLIVLFYICFAMTCWAAFGDSVKTALTLSLPQGIYSTTVQLGYSIALLFSFPLQCFPALEVAFSTMEKYYSGGGTFARNCLSSCLIVLLGVIAVVAIDYLGNVVSLLGSLVGIPVALIFPPLMHNQLVVNNSYKTDGGDSSKRNLMLTKYMNYLVAGLGLFAMIAASFTTIVCWDEGAE